MSPFTRRSFVRVAGASAAVAFLPVSLRAQSASGRVVVVGGGFGGATAAKYLRLWSPDVRVTLVEPNPTYHSCVMSNLYYPGRVSLDFLETPYDGLVSRGVEMVRDRAVAIDVDAHTVTLGRGGVLSYDKLVVAPGIDFIFPPGLEDPAARQRVPHAWTNVAEQAPLLRSRLRGMPDGGTFVLTVPPVPYRCPPGPYERACMVASYLRRAKRRSKVVVLDANPDIVAKREIFHHAFDVTHRGFVEYHPNAPVLRVDPDTLTVTTAIGSFRAGALNVIPPQRAGRIAADAGLVNVDDRWAGVDPQTFGSTAAPDVFIVGDSNGSNVGKSGHFANSEGKLVASAIGAQLAGERENPSPILGNVCFSAISLSTASSFTNHMTYRGGTMVTIPESVAESPPSTDNFELMFGWGRNLWADSLR
ncbi:MAG TPA: FAD/NAD(P)-binding oxidoreductase [Candidatus Sulfomarinibacteraceae bacterium]|nr:FAD/NAD(P)-binding oxidoreductase [Candidatus Sulfomarinibacteraceae bacterium]